MSHAQVTACFALYVQGTGHSISIFNHVLEKHGWSLFIWEKSQFYVSQWLCGHFGGIQLQLMVFITWLSLLLTDGKKHRSVSYPVGPSPAVNYVFILTEMGQILPRASSFVALYSLCSKMTESQGIASSRHQIFFLFFFFISYGMMYILSTLFLI